jgi:Retrotransposon gag protein
MSTRKQAATDADSRLEQLEIVIEDLQRRVNSQPPPQSASSEPKISSPETFDGKDPSQLPDFLLQVNLAFDLQPSRYANESIKVKYAVTYLRGPVLKWVRPLLQANDPPAWVNDFSLFAEELTKIFGDPHIVSSAARSLRKLRQTGTVSFYIAEFRQHSSLLTWNEDALISQFVEGLSDSIKDELAKTEPPTGLKDLFEMTVRLDNRLRDRDMDRREASKSTDPPARKEPRVYAPSATSSRPKLNSADRASSRPPPARLSEKQKEYRRKHNLCMYCGGQGHVAPECPIAPRNASRANASTRPPGNGQAQAQ